MKEREAVGHGSGMTMFALAITLSLGGCSLIGGSRSDAVPPVTDGAADAAADASAERTIARDFVGVLAQMDGHAAAETVVEMERGSDDDAFLDALTSELREQGYGIRLVARKGPGTLSYRRIDGDVASDDPTRRTTYEVALNALEMRRDYTVLPSGAVEPVGLLYVRGADASNVYLDESVFEQRAAASPAEDLSASSPTVAETENEPPIGESPVRVKAAPSIPSAAAEPVDESGPSLPGELFEPPLVAGGVAPDAVAAWNDSDANLFDIEGSSNFDALFADYVNVDEAVLMFGDDSLVLGQRNKRRVQAMADAHDPERDVFSVLGCSLGATDVAGGNAALALGRAGRVREALLFAGVDQARILDEGCWAETPDGRHLPARGVVLTLKRERG